MARPEPGEKRCGELRAGDQANHEGAEAQALVHMKREHRQRETDNQKGDKDHPDDGQQGQRDGGSRLTWPGGINGHGRHL